MEITGKQFIGKDRSAKGDKTFNAVSPESGKPLPVNFYEATKGEVNHAAYLAEQAFSAYSKINGEAKADFLDQIAEEIMNLGPALIERGMAETALPQGRLQGERGRTVNQLKLFAQVVREGSWVDARIDRAQPDRQPIPKADIRHMLRPLGPVAVFGASNFPLAFSVAGGDTASALASGCPVIVKGHPAHPGTSELVAGAIIKAAIVSGMPDGVFSMIQGASHEVGGWLVQHPLVNAVGFTGSFRGGKALFDLANQRERPIPVFAEMGSTNPVFILPGALQHSQKIAQGLATSVTLGVGQFCTNPGLVFLPEVDQAKGFKVELSEKINQSLAGTMLTSGIQSAYQSGTKKLAETQAIATLASGQTTKTANAVSSEIFNTSFDTFKERPELAEEVFGPSSILVDTPNREAAIEAAKSLEGHLTATIHGTEADFKEYQELFDILARKVGRLIINGYPTGVEVCHAMVHGGPYPATTAPQTTSVGTNAIQRFARPLCYQDFPQFLLPEELQNENPANIWRLIDGELSKNTI